MKFKISIKWKTLAYFLLIILVTVFAFVTLAVSEIQDGITTEISQSFEKIAEELHFSVNSLLVKALEDTELVASDPFIRSENSAKEEKLERLLRLKEVFKIYEDITLIDTNGSVIVSTDFKYRGAWQHKAWFQEALKGAFTISTLQALEGQKLVLSFTGPVKNSADKTTAVVSLQFDMTHLWAVVDHFKIGETGFAFVLDEFERIIAHPDKKNILEKSSIIPVSFMDGEDEVFYTTDSAGKKVIGVAFPRIQAGLILEAPVHWNVVVVQNEREAFTVARSIRNTILAASLIFFVLAVLLSLSLSTAITRPIIILRDAAHNISRGNFRTRIAVSTEDEIGDLAGAFNEMASQVERSYVDLEKRVEERTKELDQARSRLQALLEENYQSAKILVRKDRELTEANLRLKELDAVKSEFVSVAAHQLRTPLTGIRWSFRALLDKATGTLTPEQDHIVRDGMHVTVNAIELVNDLLNVARIEEGRFGFTFKLQSPLQVISSIIARFESRMKEKGILFEVSLPPDMSSTMFDHEKLTIAIDNLLENAFKYTPPGGRITFEVKEEGSIFLVRISDTGIGIPESQMHRLFSKFFRGDNALLFQTSGTGLGLYMVKNIIEKHKGTIEVTSKENKGTHLSIRIPITGTAPAV